MRPSRFTDAQIVDALRQVKAGTPAIDVCRKLGVTQTTFYRWRHKFEGARSSEANDVQSLRKENKRLKQIVANLLLGKLP